MSNINFKKQFILIVELAMFSFVASAQWGPNLISNQSFEGGSVPPGSLMPGQLSTYVTNWEGGCSSFSPDVFDPNAPDCAADPQYSVDIPDNKWGTISAAAGSRYLGFSESEPVMGQITASLTSGCDYRIRFQYAISTNILPLNCGGAATINSNINMVIEVRLRSSGSPCGPSILLCVTPGYNLTVWNNFVYNFTATPAMTGYDRIEFKSVNIGLLGKPVFLDDTGLEKSIVTVALAGGSSSSICTGQSVSLVSTGIGTWTASPGDPTLSGQENNNTITVTPIVNTTYTFTGSCSNASLTITVNQPPTINLGPDQVICYAGNHFIVAPYNSQYNYAWTQPPPYDCISSLNIMNAHNNGEYCVTVTDNNNCSATDCINLTFDLMPIVQTVQGLTDICQGEYVTLTDITPCPPGSTCTYSWNPGGNTSNPIVDNPLTTTTYTVTVTNQHGCSSNGQITVNVNNCSDGLFCYTIEKKDDIDNGEAIIPSKSGGFVVVGSIHKNTHSGVNDRDMYIVKYANDYNNPVFNVRMGENFPVLVNKDESGFSVIERPDGYFICGSVDLSPTNADVFVVKLRPDGQWSWGMRYGINNNSIDVGRKILNIPGAVAGITSLLVTGFTNVNGNFDFMALVIDPNNGNLLNQAIYGGHEGWDEISYDAIVSGENEYVLVGEQIDGLTGLHNMAAVRIDDHLIFQNGAVIDNAGRSQGAFSAALLGHNIYLAGWITSLDDGYPDIYVVELPSDLSLITNNKIYKNPGKDLTEVARKIKKSKDNHLIIAGIYDDLTPDGTDGLVLKVDPLNNLDADWFMKTTEQGMDESYTDLYEMDHKITLTGAYGTLNDDYDILVSRISSDDGNGCCVSPYEFDYDNAGSLKPAFSEHDYEPDYHPYGTLMDYYNINWICHEEIQRLSGTNSQVTTENTISGDNGLLISPNPSSGNFTLTCSNGKVYIEQIILTDITGREIKFHKSIKNGITNISLENCSNGIYFLNATDSNNQTYKSKICIGK